MFVYVTTTETIVYISIYLSIYIYIYIYIYNTYILLGIAYCMICKSLVTVVDLFISNANLYLCQD